MKIRLLYAVLFIFMQESTLLDASADTFTHRKTGEEIHGFVVQKMVHNKTTTHIHAKGKSPKRVNLEDYDIKSNPIGRREQVTILPIKNAISLECETQAFERSIERASNLGPLFILIEIDSPGGDASLMKRICYSISKLKYCPTVAFVSGGKYGGAYSAGAAIAFACDDIYMADNTVIGALTPYVSLSSVGKIDMKTLYGETVGEKFMSAFRAYIAALAEQGDRSGLLAKAMVDKDIAVQEFSFAGKSSFESPENIDPNQPVINTWSKKGTLLTLTALEAVQCGMADAVISAQRDLFVTRNAVDAKIIRDTEIEKARRRFDVAKKRLDRIYDSIDYDLKNIEAIGEQLEFMTSQYNREAQNLNNMVRQYYDEIAIERQRAALVNIAVRRQTVKNNISIALNKLVSTCDTAIQMNERYPELKVDVKAFQKGINTAAIWNQKIMSMN